MSHPRVVDFPSDLVLIRLKETDHPYNIGMLCKRSSRLAAHFGLQVHGGNCLMLRVRFVMSLHQKVDRAAGSAGIVAWRFLLFKERIRYTKSQQGFGCVYSSVSPVKFATVGSSLLQLHKNRSPRYENQLAYNISVVPGRNLKGYL